jgi:hypothetical protein
MNVIRKEFTHDVFLSHNSRGKAVVRAVAERLQADGLRKYAATSPAPHSAATEKTCAGCGEFKPRQDFRKDKSKPDGLRSSCRYCERRRRRERYRANPEESRLKWREYYQAHKDAIIRSVKASYHRRREGVLKQKALYRANNRDKIIETLRAHRRKNRERLIAEQRAHYRANREKLTAVKRAIRHADPEKAREINRRWRLNNPERAADLARKSYLKHKPKRIAWARMYFQTNIAQRIKVLLRNRINLVLRGNKKSSSTLVLLGCSVDEFKKHFQDRFSEGMTWEKFQTGEIHIDHIIPCAAFDLTKAEEQRRCFHYTNLQPLWARDNRKKGAKRIQSFA